MFEPGQLLPSCGSALRAAGVLLCAALWNAALPPAFGSEPVDLFSAAPVGSATRKTSGTGSGYPLDIHFEALASGAVIPGSLIRCEPEPGLFFTARVSRIEMDVNGTLSLLAPLEGHAFAFLSLSVSDDLALGEVRLPDEQRRYLIRFDPPQHRHVAGTVPDDAMDELPPGPAILPPPQAPSDDPQARKASSDAPDVLGAGPTVIDVMIVYTPAAATWAGGTAGSCTATGKGRRPFRRISTITPSPSGA